jgi:hypothetical protein
VRGSCGCLLLWDRGKGQRRARDDWDTIIQGEAALRSGTDNRQRATTDSRAQSADRGTPALLCPALLYLLYLRYLLCSTLSTLFYSVYSVLLCSTLSTLLCSALLCPAARVLGAWRHRSPINILIRGRERNESRGGGTRHFLRLAIGPPRGPTRAPFAASAVLHTLREYSHGSLTHELRINASGIPRSPLSRYLPSI